MEGEKKGKKREGSYDSPGARSDEIRELSGNGKLGFSAFQSRSGGLVEISLPTRILACQRVGEKPFLFLKQSETPDSTDPYAR